MVGAEGLPCTCTGVTLVGAEDSVEVEDWDGAEVLARVGDLAEAELDGSVEAGGLILVGTDVVEVAWARERRAGGLGWVEEVGLECSSEATVEEEDFLERVEEMVILEVDGCSFELMVVVGGDGGGGDADGDDGGEVRSISDGERVEASLTARGEGTASMGGTPTSIHIWQWGLVSGPTMMDSGCQPFHAPL